MPQKTQTEKRVSVLFPLAVPKPYDYRVPAGMEIGLGNFVRAPLGRKLKIGVVWTEQGDTNTLPALKLKDIDSVLACSPLPRANREFVDWLSTYCMAPAGVVLRMAVSVPEALRPLKSQKVCQLAESPPPVRLTKARKKVLAAISESPPCPVAELAQRAGVSPSVVHGLIRAGLLESFSASASMAQSWAAPNPNRVGPILSTAQQLAVNDLTAKVRAQDFSVTLLDGVTGSGKTEVYFATIAECLKQGRQALILLPEIALSAQWLSRFKERFGVSPALWHSDVSLSRRREAWRMVAAGRAPVVVGARSALHLPFPDLGLIVVDEEHDASFKQEDGVIYHARDMAVVRGRLAPCPVVLASATPSLETMVNVWQGRYQHLVLPERHGAAAPPDIQLVNMLENGPEPQHWISPPLAGALKETLARGEQSLLFLNRRGYAPLTLCGACGHRLSCPNCTAWLVEHRRAGWLQCHHCGYKRRLPEVCPECGEEDSFRACGPGVERLAEEVQELLPQARLLMVTSDTVKSPAAAEAFVAQVVSGAVDVLIGTQIIAKGHHFPRLTLVGAVDADMGLAGGDLRAAERTWQLLHQVAGRAGRTANRPGRAFIQTTSPDSPVMQALADGGRKAFLKAEAVQREVFNAPPFGRWAAVIVSGLEEQAVEATALALGRTAPCQEDIQVLGPAPAPLSLLRGRHRRRLLLKADKSTRIQPIIQKWLNQVNIPRSVRVRVDIDPQSFL